MRVKQRIMLLSMVITFAAFVCGCASSSSSSTEAPPDPPELSPPVGSEPGSEGSPSTTGQIGEGEGASGDGSGAEGAVEPGKSNSGSSGVGNSEEAGPGDGEQDDIPSGQAGSSGGGLSPPDGSPPTVDEATAELDERLRESSGKFDQQMREELQRLAAEAAARESDEGITAGGGSTPTSGSGDGRAGGSDSGAESRRSGAEGDQSSGEVGGSGPEASGSAPVPPDVGDGADDDIVARQLREAAMNEKDPELREKLWDEYRRYKASIAGADTSGT
jgi:hypothetical protein